MRVPRVPLFLVLALALYAPFTASAQSSDDSSALMVAAARDFVASLDDDQRSLALFPFTQAGFEKWHYIPMRKRAGLRFDAMTPEQVRLAHALISSGLSRSGYQKATRVMSQQQLIYELEVRNGRTPFTDIRNPDYYYFAIFGDPREDSVWGWRVEGHHISFHWAVNDGAIVSSSPTFYGSEPHNVTEGGRRLGLRVLGREEDLARALLESLDDTQRSQAVKGDKAPNDILTRNRSEVAFDGVPDDGLARSDMSDKQRGLLQALINEYVFNVPRDLAERRLKVIDDSGDDIRFVWMGDTARVTGAKYYYRVHGKNFLIEFDNVQLNGNHSHCVWRDYENDFGRDVLADHYRSAHATD